MIRRILQLLGYFRYAFVGSTWRYALNRADSLVEDHLAPLSELRLPQFCVIHPTVSMRVGRNIVLGNYTRVQPFCVLWASPNAKIRIGDYSGLGPGTKIFASNHQFASGTPYSLQPWTEKDVTIGDDVWIGAGSIIVAGVTIGDRSVIAAGSVVTKDIPSDSIAAGVPARVIRRRV